MTFQMDPARGRKAPVSSVDVAQAAGVSQAAVSRVFTPGASASAAMRAKVMAAAQKLGYRPNAIARSLTKRSTHMIGLVTGNLLSPFHNRLLEISSGRLQAQGYWTLLINVAHPEGLEETLPAVFQYQLDGLIITSATWPSRMADECARLGIRVVLLNKYSPDSDVNAVYCDDVRGGRLAADALIDAGHRRFACIAGGPTITSQDRAHGFISRLRERGFELTGHERGDDSYLSGDAAARRLLVCADRPDAIFCTNDLMALAALDVARCGLGVRVPEDLSIIGSDDILQASWPRYDLTTVRQPVEQMADAIVELLLGAIENPDGGCIVRTFTPRLAVRGSARLAPHPPFAAQHTVAPARRRAGLRS